MMYRVLKVVMLYKFLPPSPPQTDPAFNTSVLTAADRKIRMIILSNLSKKIHLLLLK